MKAIDSVLDRLLAGEIVFLPHQNWETIQPFGSGRLYSAARNRGKFVHFVQHSENGTPGLRVWVDDTRGTPGRHGGQSGLTALFEQAQRVDGES